MRLVVVQARFAEAVEEALLTSALGAVVEPGRSAHRQGLSEVRFMPERRSIIATGCTGAVIALVPLSPAQVLAAESLTKAGEFLP